MVTPSEQTKLVMTVLTEYAKTEGREFFFLFADEKGFVGTFRTESYSNLLTYLGKGEFRFFLYNLLALLLAALGKQGDQDIN